MLELVLHAEQLAFPAPSELNKNPSRMGVLNSELANDGRQSEIKLIRDKTTTSITILLLI